MSVNQLQLLPSEVMSHALQFLPADDLKSTSLVSRRLYLETQAEMLWYLRCEAAGVGAVAPASGSWVSFGRRLGLGLTKQNQFRGAWEPLVGYSRTSSLVPEELHDASIATFPWEGFKPSEGSTRRSASSCVASVAVIPVSNSQLVRDAVDQLVFSSTLVVPTHQPKSLVDVDVPVSPSARQTPHPSDGDELGEQLPGPQLQYFDLCPRLDDLTKVVHIKVAHADLETLEAGTDADERAVHCRHTARILEMAWGVASNIIFLGDSSDQLLRWCNLATSQLTTPNISTSRFCTHKNTPNISFVSLGEGAEDLPLGDLPTPLRSWLCHRSDRVYLRSSLASLLDDVLPIPKVYAVPGWVAPLVSPPTLQPHHLLTMAVKSSEGGNRPSDMWTSDLIVQVADPIEHRAHAFYSGALRTESEDATQQWTVPMDSSELVTLHRHFFFSALRSYSLQLFPFCGDSVTAGTQLLEVLKRNVNTTFREVWKENNLLSKKYSSCVFTSVFQSVREEYLLGDGFQTKHGLKNWFATMNRCIATFRAQAKGFRSHEVLDERLTNDLLPEFLQFSLDHPAHPHLHHSDLSLACHSLQISTQELLWDFRATQDALLGQMQKDTAVYTTMTGTEWVLTLHSESCSELRRLRPLAEEWEFAMLGKAAQLNLGTEALFMDSDGERLLPLPFLRREALHSAMEEEQQQRTMMANASSPSRRIQSSTFLKDVSVVQHETKSTSTSRFLHALRRIGR